jgi:hypothetical protein
MADSKISDLTELTSVNNADLVAIIDDPSGTPVTKKITKANLVTNIASSDIINTAVTLSETQTLTSKTLTNPSLGASYLDIERITIPSSPSADQGRVYVKQIDANNDGIFIKIKKGGSFVEVQIA